MKVSSLMMVRPVTVRPDTGVRTALRLLATHAITTMPVVDPRGRILGVVGEADLLGAGRESAVVEQVMRRTTVLVHPETDLDDVTRTLDAAGVKSLPVVDSADQVVGMVSRSDIVRMLARDDEVLQQDVTDALRAAGLHGWQVAVNNGTVDLCGAADGGTDGVRAGRVAEQVLGVAEVLIR
jgi:CBS-domain-containing membrane protein